MLLPKVYHPGLSATFHGLRHPISSEDAEVGQFRGIKYGHISSRFKQSTLNENFPEVCNASIFGPKCPQPMGIPHLEDSLIGLPPGFTSHAEDLYDEFECLNLNITTPAQACLGSNLPVMVYIHGGGGRSGANSDWWCDGGSIVRRSILMGKPVVMVAINYRLAVLGYLGSSELQTKNGKANGGNYGLRDIRTAIDWVSKHIAPFGGSSTNITIYGESAGSHAVQAQLHSLLPANFHRAISQSQSIGAPLLTTPQSISHKSSVYEVIKKYLNVTTTEELEIVPWQDLLAAYQVCDPMHAFGEQAMIDNEFLSDDWEDISAFNSGQGELILGNTGAEGMVMKMLFGLAPTVEPKPSPQALISTLHTIVGAEKVDAILQSYNIDSTTPKTETAEALLAIIEDIMWYKTADDLAIKMRKRGIKVYEYSFEQLQPFTGPFKGTAAHSLDLVYLHGDPSLFSITPNAAKEIAMQEAIQDSWIEFANGGKAWDEDIVRVFGPEGKVMQLEYAAFFRDMKRGHAWEALGALTADEKIAFSGVVLDFCGQLLGSG